MTALPTSRRLRAAAAALAPTLLLALALAPAARAQHPHAAPEDRPDRATSTHRFEDAARWAAVFDDPGRDAWQKPASVVSALRLAPGDVLADVGAGTGYFTPYWSRAVGEEGVVFAVEVEPNLVAHLRERSEKEATANVVPVLGSRDHPRLPPGAVDVAILVDVYHHIDRRRDYFRRFRRVLAPEGRLVVIDWRKEGDFPVGPPPPHRLAAEQVTAELAAAGYEPAGSFDFLPYQYGRVFRVAPGGEGDPSATGR